MTEKSMIYCHDAIRKITFQSIHLLKTAEDDYEVGRCRGLMDAVDIIKKLQTTETEPGKWVHDINNLYGCSVCGNRETMSHKKYKKYCSNCGKKMEGYMM